tara:strand:+ start:664 stop:1335 length:672 start_codon:yes stop_codon:yes gene_type:complete
MKEVFGSLYFIFFIGASLAVLVLIAQLYQGKVSVECQNYRQGFANKLNKLKQILGAARGPPSAYKCVMNKQRKDTFPVKKCKDVKDPAKCTSYYECKADRCSFCQLDLNNGKCQIEKSSCADTKALANVSVGFCGGNSQYAGARAPILVDGVPHPCEDLHVKDPGKNNSEGKCREFVGWYSDTNVWQACVGQGDGKSCIKNNRSRFICTRYNPTWDPWRFTLN